MDEVFRFMILRRPQEVTEESLASYASLGDTTNKFQVDLQKLKEAGDLREMSIVASKYIEGVTESHGSFIKDSEDLGVYGDAINELIEAFGGDPSSDDVTTASTIKEAFGKAPTEVVSSPEFTEVKRNVANSLIALTIAHREQEPIYDTLVDASRVLDIVEKVATGDTTLAAKQRFAQPVLLPEAIFPLPAAKSTQVATTPKSTESSPQEVARKKLTDIRLAMDELGKLKAKDFKVAVAPTNLPASPQETPTLLPMGPQEVPNFVPWTLSEQAINGLTSGTRSLVAGFGIDLDTAPLPEVTNFLESKMTELGALAYQPVPHKKLIKIGSQWVDSDALAPAPSSEEQQDLAPVSTGAMRELGVADLDMVKQELLRYEAGEVAHIENVLAGEKKERTHHRTTRVEESFLVETQTEQETERDLQTTERFELQREAEQSVKEEHNFDTSVTVKYGGVVDVEASAKYAYKNAREESNRTATTFARDVTERTVDRVREQVREQRTRTTIEEIEEINLHGVDNASRDEHVVGLYRWVDKIYRSQVYNYGLRTMYEFVVPEPAVLLSYSRKKGIIECFDSLDVPKDPGDLTPDKITPENYQSWVGSYKVVNAPILPPRYRRIVKVIRLPSEQEQALTSTKDSQNGKGFAFHDNVSLEIPIEKGYQAKFAWLMFQSAFEDYTEYAKLANNPGVVEVTGIVQHHLGEDGGSNWSVIHNNPFHPHNTAFPPMRRECSHVYQIENSGPAVDAIPLAIVADISVPLVVTLVLLCERSDEGLNDWRHKTYDAIITAYLNLKSEYEERLAAASIEQGIAITGRNPLLNRELEQNELNRAALQMLMDRHHKDFMGQGAIRQAKEKQPEIDIGEANQQAPLIQFLEQAFEWTQMVYSYYPYFWARKELWPVLQQLDDPDPVYARFLRAGAARVVVPVRPGYERALRHYWATGEPWEGKGPPSVADSAFVPIVEELKEQQGQYSAKGTGSISVTNKSDQVVGVDTAFTDKDAGREIFIEGFRYEIGAVNSKSEITLTKPYAGPTKKGLSYALGMKAIGEPWTVKIPTTLVILQKDAELPDFTRGQRSEQTFGIDIPQPRLAPGKRGQVSITNEVPENVRLLPGLDTKIITAWNNGTEFDVKDGPIFNDGYLWWLCDNGTERGWCAEGKSGKYYLDVL